ncbi:MAG: Crp/Fnr family transcriptional regulator [Patescibacteria group bacterium]|nr:Crp/Fnr family transcriptional regulator [Actinomycetota bacterium]MCL5438503.1 Crp/Fnr family transcriptional regulator [Patescibacteria group bacterium]
MNPLTQKLEKFFSKYKSINYKKGEVILRPEDIPLGVFYIKSGYVKLYSVSDEGNELTLNIFKPHTYFSMMWTISDIKNSLFFEAMTNTELLRAPKEDVVKFLKSEPEILFDLTRRLLIGLDAILTRMDYLLLGDARSRVMSTVLSLIERFGIKEKDEIILEIPLTHKDISNLAGLTRETTSIELKKLSDKGIIINKNRQLIVKNIAKLREESLIYKEGEESADYPL